VRIPSWLAWALVLMAFFTAGILRQFHDGTPSSPFVPGAVGNLLFGGIFLLLLVTAWEWRRGAVPGDGVRLGSLTPLLLMLLGEKWLSLTLYGPLFDRVASENLGPADLDARFRAFAGVGLLFFVVLVAFFSSPTGRKTWRRARPTRWPEAAVAATLTLVAVYGLLGGLGWVLGGTLYLEWPAVSNLLLWVLVGQAVLALSEELYYRGLLMSEVERLTPRLGARRPALRRWLALTATSLLFGMEHLSLNPTWEQIGRQLVFTVSLGLLLGLLVMVSGNLHLAAAFHAWINWLLLGAAPHFVTAAGTPALPAGTYIGLSMILAFVAAFGIRRLRRRHRLARPPLVIRHDPS
jgi:membrane protease YdiL (CAAX protease family)